MTQSWRTPRINMCAGVQVDFEVPRSHDEIIACPGMPAWAKALHGWSDACWLVLTANCCFLLPSADRRCWLLPPAACCWLLMMAAGGCWLLAAAAGDWATAGSWACQSCRLLAACCRSRLLLPLRAKILKLKA